MPPNWNVRLSEAAQKDFNDIFLWTVEQFGIEQARLYREVVLDALQTLQNGPDVIGTRTHVALPGGIKVLHVARSGKRGRHFIVFDGSVTGCIQVVRILHDSMDLARHVEPERH
jgi:toxin ParE1/3/4